LFFSYLITLKQNKNMARNSTTFIYKAVAIIALLVLTIYGLIVAKAFLAPLTVAAILALLLLPIVRILEQWNLSKGLAALVGTLILFAGSIGFFVLVAIQLNNVVEKWDTIKETMQPKIEQATNSLIDNTPVTQEKLSGLKNNIKNFSLVGSRKTSGSALTYLTSIVSFFGVYLLVFIHVYFMIRYRSKFKKFVLKFFSDENSDEVRETIHEIAQVAQGYLLGKLKLIAILAVVYSIGLGVSGVSNFILIAILAAVLTLIPYLGNIIGYGLAIIFGYLMNGELGILIGITVTFVVAQFIESYVLQPYVVGDEVDLNPFFVILIVILGNLMWGIVGMVVAIPMLGILNIIFLHVPPLQPFGFLLKKNKE
jgi:predicted PurR-regulated permease PerM